MHRGLRKGVAAGEKLETTETLGSRTVQLSLSGREALCKLLSPTRIRPFVVGLWLLLMPSGPPPPRSHPNCTHNILLLRGVCFPPPTSNSLHGDALGRGQARLWKSQGLPRRRPLQTFPGLQVLQAGRESAPSWAAARSRVRGSPDRVTTPVYRADKGWNPRAWGPRDHEALA